jgi:hypothetical protein
VKIRVQLPQHLRTLARVAGEVVVEVENGVEDGVTLASVLDALEAAYPVLAGTIRDHGTHKRRDFLRFFACGRDLSLQSPDTVLPEAVASGDQPLLVVGALAGG